MFANLGGIHLLLILAVVLLLFGATRLPALSKGVGQSIRIFRKEVHNAADDEASTTAERNRDSGPDATPSR